MFELREYGCCLWCWRDGKILFLFVWDKVVLELRTERDSESQLFVIQQQKNFAVLVLYSQSILLDIIYVDFFKFSIQQSRIPVDILVDYERVKFRSPLWQFWGFRNHYHHHHHRHYRFSLLLCFSQYWNIHVYLLLLHPVTASSSAYARFSRIAFALDKTAMRALSSPFPLSISPPGPLFVNAVSSRAQSLLVFPNNEYKLLTIRAHSIFSVQTTLSLYPPCIYECVQFFVDVNTRLCIVIDPNALPGIYYISFCTRDFLPKRFRPLSIPIYPSS